MEIFTEVVGLLRVIVWPAVVLLLARRFEPELRQFLQTRRSSHVPEFPLQVSTPQERNLKPQTVRMIDNPVVASDIETLRNDPALASATTPDKREEVLINALAATRTACHFRAVLSSIWASQLKILRHLDTKGDGIEVAEGLRGYYDDAVRRHPETFLEYPLEQYLDFLRTALLVEHRNGGIAITEVGRDFLKYVTASGLPEPTQG